MEEKKLTTAEAIKKIAITHFATYGYRGASLSAIAQEVHIKKPSIYAHYVNKEELFYACMQEATELNFKQYHRLLHSMEGEPMLKILYAFLNQFENLEESDPTLLFQQRFSYFPPEELKETVMEYSNEVITRIEDLLHPLFQSWGEKQSLTEGSVYTAQVAFLCLYDGLMVERLIGNKKKFQYRLNYSWAFFIAGLDQIVLKKRK